MFESFSEQARLVVFATRFKAGQRGAEAIGVDDLLVGLIIGDRGMLGSVFQELHPDLPSSAFMSLPETHSPFLPADIASDLLAKIESLFPRSDAIPTTAEIPVSADLKSVIEDAKALQNEFKQNHVEVLHLWAAALGKSSQGTSLLRQAGIDREKALQMIRRSHLQNDS